MKINLIKKLYHGSNCEFETFDFSRAKGFKDFGKGFYLTSSLSQAQKWAQNKSKVKSKAYIYCYSVREIFEREWNILELLQYDTAWIDFITESRLAGKETDFDIIYDRIADNQYREISEVLARYNDREIDAQEAIGRIKWKSGSGVGDQYCFKNEQSLSLLKKEQVIVQYKEKDGRWKQERV